MLKKKYIWAITYGLILTVFTVYAILDTFVLEQVYDTDVIESDNNNYNESETTSNIHGDDSITPTSVNSSEHTTDSKDESSTEEIVTEEPTTIGTTITDTSYIDNNMRITITECRHIDATVYIADIKLSSPKYLQTALAKGTYGKNVRDKTSVISKEVNAILAVNGDYYGSREKGYVIRNGKLYRGEANSNNEDLVIYKDGTFEIIKESEISAEELLNNGARHVFSFGPAIVEGSQISVSKNDEVGIAMNDNPRTSIGIIDNLHYVFVVSDGRTSESKGLSLYELAGFMQELGCKTAYNLDGGGSSTMVFNGKIINKPVASGSKIGERKVSDIVYIGYSE
jgi:exopolysaccharide biosynthesis protein